MKESDCLACPCCGGHAKIQQGKQYRIMIQDWHDIEEERYQPCTILCSVCGLSITRAACNAEHSGVNGAQKEARRLAIESWNVRKTNLEDDDLIRIVTKIVRESDKTFEKIGGSTRHWVRDCFLPILNKDGLFISCNRKEI